MLDKCFVIAIAAVDTERKKLAEDAISNLEKAREDFLHYQYLLGRKNVYQILPAICSQNHLNINTLSDFELDYITRER